MPDHNQHAKDPIEDILAAFADQVQTDSVPSAATQTEDQELNQLQETILFLHRAAPGEPSRAQTEKIRANVQKAWENQFRPKPTLIEKIGQLLTPPAKTTYRSAVRRRQLAAIRIMAAAALVVIAAFILLPTVGITGSETSGTASGNFGLWALVISVLLLAGFGLWWWFTSKRK